MISGARSTVFPTHRIAFVCLAVFVILFFPARGADLWLVQQAKRASDAQVVKERRARVIRHPAPSAQNTPRFLAHAKIIQAYPSQWVVEGLTDGAREQARSEGCVATRLPGEDALFLSSGRRDIEKEPSWTSASQPASRATLAKKQVFLLKYRGPVIPEWLHKIEAAGCKPLQSIPNFGFLVYGRPADLPAQARAPEIAWTGSFRAGDKFAPALAAQAAQAAPPDASQNLIVQYFAEDDGNETALKLKGFAQGGFSPARVGNHYTVRLKAASKDLGGIAALPLVYHVEDEPQYRLHGERQGLIVANRYPPGTLRIPAPAGPDTRYQAFLQSKQADGSSQLVHIMDDGLDTGALATVHPDLQGRVTAILNYSSDSAGECRGGHGSLNAGIIAGSPSDGINSLKDSDGFLLGQGIAPAARLLAAKIFRNSGSFDIGARSFGTLMAEAAPYHPVVSSNSWGADVSGRYTADSADFDALVRDIDPDTPGDQECSFCFSAGNAGGGPGGPYGTLDAPASAKNVIAVGATESTDNSGPDGSGFGPSYADNLNEIAFFSSQGPTADGRLGVTIMAPGTHITGPASTSPIFDGSSVSGGPLNDFLYPPTDAYWPEGQSSYTWSSGTSHSCPAVAGAVALFNQTYRNAYGAAPSPALVKSALAASATNMAASINLIYPPEAHAPSPRVGWGLLNLDSLLPNAGLFPPLFISDEEHIFESSGEAVEFTITPMSSSVPLKISLCWTDAPGIPYLNTALVNDLDLQVVHGGDVSLGNVFDLGWSAAGGSPDRLNTLESVFIQSPTVEPYTVRIVAANLAGDGVPSHPGAIDQDFALYVTGGLLQSSRATVKLDRASYTLSDTARIEVSDSDLRPQSAALVLMQSDTDPQGDFVTLPATASGTGVFRGNWTLSPDVLSNSLRVSDGDEIRAIFIDQDTGGGTPAAAIATARADGQPPTIQNVRLGDIGIDTAEILFDTGEPALAEVDYGLSAPSEMTAPDDAGFTLQHRVVLRGLTPETLYRFAVRAHDQAGNESIGETTLFRTGRFVLNAMYDMESGTEEPFSHAAATGTDDWRIISTAIAHSPTHAWFSADTPTTKDATLMLPAAVQPLAPHTELTFWHTYAFEMSSSGSAFYDGGALEYSLDGSTWLDLGPHIVEGGYNATLALGSALAGRDGWGGGTLGQMTQVRVDLDSFTGARPAFRFRIACDSSVGAGGWCIDDIQIRRAAASRGTVRFDAPAYRAGRDLWVTVSDADLDAASTVDILLQSASEPSPGETIHLSSVSPGLFAASVPIVSGEFGTDGKIDVSDKDVITATYADANDGTGAPGSSVATAVADLVPPELGLIFPEPAYHRAARAWINTKAPSTVVLHFALEGEPERTAGSPIPATHHEILLSDLIPSSRYRLDVEMSDVVGNTITYGSATGDNLWFVTQNEQEIFADTMDGALNPLWSHSASAGEDTWAVLPRAEAKSPASSWFVADASLVTDSSLVLRPTFGAPLPANTMLIFWHTYSLEADPVVGYDGGVVEISTDNGANWQDLEPCFVLGSHYDLPMSTEYHNPLGARRAFSGGALGAMRPVFIELSRFAGAENPIFRFRIGCDVGVSAPGWLIDNVQLATYSPCLLFEPAKANPAWTLYR